MNIPNRPASKLLTLALMTLVIGSGSLAFAVPVEEVQITSGDDSAGSRLILDAQGVAHVAYVSDDSPGSGWGVAFGYVQIEDLSIQNETFLPTTLDLAGPAGLLPRPDGGVVAFHHQWSHSDFEQFYFTTVDSIGNTLTTNPITGSAGCTNTDSNAGEVDLGDGSYGFVYTSCRNTGLNSVDRNNLFYTRWSSDGVELVDNLEIDDSTFIRSGRVAAVADESGAIHVAYVDSRSGPDEIRYLQLDLDGNIVVPSTVVGSSAGVAAAPAMVIDSSEFLHLFWADDQGTDDPQTFRLVLSSSGVPQIPPTQVSFAPDGITRPVAAIGEDDRIHLLWHEDMGTIAVYLQMDPAGTTMFGPEPLETSVLLLGLSSLCIDDNQNAVTCWTSTDGNVFYGRFSTDSPSDVSTDDPTIDPDPHGPRPKLMVSPNPIELMATFRYQQSVRSHVEFGIYDLAGRRVVTLVDGWKGPGMQETIWDGTNADGARLRSGRYFARLQVGRDKSSTPILILE